jgi:hypothetical protein
MLELDFTDADKACRSSEIYIYYFVYLSFIVLCIEIHLYLNTSIFIINNYKKIYLPKKDNSCKNCEMYIFYEIRKYFSFCYYL